MNPFEFAKIYPLVMRAYDSVLAQGNFIFILGPVAQWIEHITSNDTVTGSSPVGITNFPPHPYPYGRYPRENFLAHSNLSRLSVVDNGNFDCFNCMCCANYQINLFVFGPIKN